jgi:copper chaperone
MNHFQFAVSGLTCQGCVRSVTRAIHKADPAAEVAVDLEQLQLVARTCLTAAEVQTRIEAAGFSAQLLAA